MEDQIKQIRERLAKTRDFTLKEYKLSKIDRYWVLEHDGDETVQTIVQELPVGQERFDADGGDMKFFASAKADIQYLLDALLAAEAKLTEVIAERDREWCVALAEHDIAAHANSERHGKIEVAPPEGQ